jgi:hypothetical protein
MSDRLTHDRIQVQSRPRVRTVRGVCAEGFSIMWNGCCVTIEARKPFHAEPGLRALLDTTDRVIRWEDAR